MNKQTASIHAPLADLDLTAFGLSFGRMISKMRSLAKINIPTGYQDENGFQLGVKPAEKEIKWPPVW
jgi:hypothetical protein